MVKLRSRAVECRFRYTTNTTKRNKLKISGRHKQRDTKNRCQKPARFPGLLAVSLRVRKPFLESPSQGSLRLFFFVQTPVNRLIKPLIRSLEKFLSKLYIPVTMF